jgi:hypothetical protein
MTTTNEPNAIALLRQGVYVPDAADCDAILQAYDTIVAERDAAVRELHNARLNSEIVAEVNRRFDAECTTLRARLAACERVVEAAKRVIDADTDVLQAVAIVMLREAFAAEAQGESNV